MMIMCRLKAAGPSETAAGCMGNERVRGGSRDLKVGGRIQGQECVGMSVAAFLKAVGREQSSGKENTGDDAGVDV